MNRPPGCSDARGLGGRRVELEDGLPAHGSTTLAAEINTEHERAYGKAREALEHARRAGELLLRVRDSLKHGEWLPWIEQFCSFSARQAQRYLTLAENWTALAAKYDTLSHLTVTCALRLLRRPDSETDRARALQSRHEALRREMALLQRAADAILADPHCTAEEVCYLALEAQRLEVAAGTLRAESMREAGRLIIALREQTKLSESDLVAVINDGSLIRACNERIAELEAA
jgi:hypothetical protein